MPRPREVTMGKVSKDQAHEAAIKLALKRSKPYEIIAKHKFKLTDHKEWMIIYRGPDAPKPVIILDKIRNVKKARRWKKLLERAWAEGVYAASLK